MYSTYAHIYHQTMVESQIRFVSSICEHISVNMWTCFRNTTLGFRLNIWWVFISCQSVQIVGRSEHRPASAPAWLLGALLLLLSYTGRVRLRHLCLRSLCLNQHSALWQRTGTEQTVSALFVRVRRGPSTPLAPHVSEQERKPFSWGCFQKPVRSLLHHSWNLCHAPHWFVNQNGRHANSY